MRYRVSPGHRRVSSRHTDGVTSLRFGATVFLLELGRITRFSVLHRGGAQGKSELCVQRANTMSNHCRGHEAGTLHHFGDRSQGLLITPCLIKTQFSQSFVGMVVPSTVFQLVPNRLSLSWRLYKN